MIKITVSPSKIEQSCETFPIKIEDSSSLTVPYTLEQGISTRVFTTDKAASTLNPLTQDSGCSPQEFTSKKIETLPFSTSSVKAGTPEIVTVDKYTKTKVNLLESIRGIIREELGKGEQLKMSGIMYKHEGVGCSHCKMNPIVGIRYKCSECDVNFCESCEFTEEHEHPFYKMKSPGNASIEIPRPMMKIPPLVVKNEKRIGDWEEKKGGKDGEKSKMYEIVQDQAIKPSPPGIEKKIVTSVVKANIGVKPHVVDIYTENLKALKNMGFLDEALCLRALTSCNNELETAIELMFNSSPIY